MYIHTYHTYTYICTNVYTLINTRINVIDLKDAFNVHQKHQKGP